MTARSILAIALAVITIQYLSTFAVVLFGMISGPFATLFVGLILLFIAKTIYHSPTPT